MPRSWVFEPTPKQIEYGTVDLKQAKDFIPDEFHAPSEKELTVRWDDDEVTRHTVRRDDFRISKRNQRETIYQRTNAKRLVITALAPGEFLITPLEQ